jgi:RNA-directed DNA polymerase
MPSDSSISQFILQLGLKDSVDNQIVLNSIINSSHSHYRSFYIPKRKGGQRKIDSPYPTLRQLQQLIFNSFINKLEYHRNCFAFVKGRNAISHAKYHLGCSELLTLDIKDFFPSISRQMIFEVFDSTEISTEFSNHISYICSLNNSLPQGACTSPALSNAIFLPVDTVLEKVASSLSLKYSRYADDLAFSGETIPRNLPSLVNKILLSRGFTLNNKKTKLKVKGTKKIITGVSISSGQLKVPKVFKRDLRASIYELEKYKDDLFSMTNFSPLIYEKVIGKLNYLLQIEPENTYAKRKRIILIEAYKEFSKNVAL